MMTMKLSMLLLLIVTNLVCIWSAPVLPECTSRENVLKYHSCMQSIYGIENVYREACISWNGMAVSGNVTEPKCLHHLQISKKTSAAMKNNKQIEVECLSYSATPIVHFPDNVTVDIRIQTIGKECEQQEEIKFEFPKRNFPGEQPSNCKKPQWNKNGITVAANLNGPRAIYIDQNDNLYVADMNHRRLQKFSKSSKKGSTIVGSAKSSPIDVGIDAYGNIFKATGEQWIVKSSGGASISFGDGTDQKDCLFGVFINNTDMYVADSLGNFSSRIRKYSSSLKNLKNLSSKTKKGGGATTKQRYAVFIDQCDTFNTVNIQEHEIQTHLNSNYTPNWGYIEPNVPTAHRTYPSNMLQHFGGYYVVGREQNCVMSMGQGVVVGVPSEEIPANPSFSFGFSMGLKSMQVDSGLKKNNSGATTAPSKKTLADAKHLNEPITIAFDSKSNLYVADFKNNRVQKFLFQSGDLKC